MRSDTKDVADFLHGSGSRFALAEMTDAYRGGSQREWYLTASDSQMRGDVNKATTCKRQEHDYSIIQISGDVAVIACMLLQAPSVVFNEEKDADADSPAVNLLVKGKRKIRN